MIPRHARAEGKTGIRNGGPSYKSILTAVLGASLLGACASSGPGMDAVTRATATSPAGFAGELLGSGDRCRIILASAPGGSTEKIARAMAPVLEARILSPGEAESEVLHSTGLLGFGSGILDQAHHKALLSFVDTLPPQEGRQAFLFSTSGVSRDFALRHGIDDPHAALRRRLEEKGFQVIGEFNCAGFNANSFLKYFGGMHKGRPNAEDLARAEDFARGLRSSVEPD